MDISIEDAYVALGIAPGAPAGEVKAAWRRLASRWHPDRNPSAEAAALMQRINGAYERILVEHGIEDETADAAPAAGSAGPVLRRRVRLSLEEAALGTTRTLRGRVIEPCGACDAAGTIGATGCTHCGGSGQVRSSLWFGWVPSSSRCGQCDGRGQVPAACADCGGRGHHRHRYERRVRFPAGVREGDVLNAHVSVHGADGVDGTLELHLRIAPHPFFTTDAADPSLLRCDMPVHGFTWLAEHWAEVPTLEGPQQMRLRRGHLTYRLRGQGLPRERGSAQRGDLVVTVAPRFPQTLSPRQQALVEELAATAADRTAP
jgi:molecular chaperone DnaJ